MSVASNLFGVFLGTGAVLLVLNEVRGLMLAVPVLYGVYQAGGSFTAIWIAICSLAGIALSVVLPVMAAKGLFGRGAARSARLRR